MTAPKAGKYYISATETTGLIANFLGAFFSFSSKLTKPVNY